MKVRKTWVWEDFQYLLHCIHCESLSTLFCVFKCKPQNKQQQQMKVLSNVSMCIKYNLL